MKVPKVITAAAKSTSLARTFWVASDIALAKYMRVVVILTHHGEAGGRAARSGAGPEYALAESITLAAKRRARPPGSRRSNPRNQPGLNEDEDAEERGRGRAAATMAATNLAERLLLGDVPRERQEEKDHGEDADPSEHPLDAEDGRALATGRRVKRMVSYRRQASRPIVPRRDDAEVAADEVRVREVAEAEVDPPGLAAGSASATRWRRSDQLDRHRGQEPGQEDAPGEATDLRPQLRQISAGTSWKPWMRK